MPGGLTLSLFRAARRLLLPRDVGSPHEAEALTTAAALADDAARRGRGAAVAYWTAEFLSLVPVVVISHAARLRLFGGDTAVIGQPLVLDGRPSTIIGVMPPGFHFPRPEVEFWTPAQFPAELRASRTEFMLVGVGRLADGRGSQEAGAELETIMARLRADHPQANSNVGISIQPMQDALVGTVQRPLWILMASVRPTHRVRQPGEPDARAPYTGASRSRCGRRSAPAVCACSVSC